MIGIVGVETDGALNGVEGFGVASWLGELASGEVMEGEGIMGVEREGFLKRAFGLGVAAEIFELEGAQHLRGNVGRVGHFLIPRNAKTSS